MHINNTVEKYTTNKDKDGIIVDGYKYRLDKAFKNTNLWRCTQTQCGAYCKTNLTDLMVLDGCIFNDQTDN
jgi:hypothetical protein